MIIGDNEMKPRELLDLRHTIEKLKRSQRDDCDISDRDESVYLKEFLVSKRCTDPELLTINELVECFATLEAMKIVKH